MLIHICRNHALSPVTYYNKIHKKTGGASFAVSAMAKQNLNNVHAVKFKKNYKGKLQVKELVKNKNVMAGHA